MAETIAHIIYKNGTTVGFCLESDPARAQVYAEVAYRPGPDEWITVAGLTLSDGLADLERSVKTLESLRPHWAQGYTSDSMAAQASTAALSQLWEMLGATNQTEAVQRVTILQGIARGDVWVTPLPRQYAVQSITGAHIGMWSKREDAVAAMREYEGSSLIELAEVPRHG